ncbi:MAG TPA: c-type cytochrome [Acidobacteriaceae bacterium]|nr:c-type cytochrome [Acidobacteriaceae bacterium]
MRLKHGAFAAIFLIAASTFSQNSGTPAAARKLPIWAYPVPAPNGTGNGVHKSVDSSPKHVPGSTATYTLAEIRDLFEVPDWFPDSHPPMPQVVAHGRKPDVFACGYCHLPNGQGRPENASIAGLPAAYIEQQMSDFKNGLRKSSEPAMSSVSRMVAIGKAVNPEEVKAAAEYFSSMKLKPWIRVVEVERVPKFRIAGGMLVPDEGGGTEPIGNRIIEMPENLERTELRDSTSGFVAYVPAGSLKRGENLVMTGANGTTIPCVLCHGADLKGMGNVPSIAGRSPSQMARQIIDIQTGARNGSWTQLMKGPVSKLTDEDIVSITAYLASQTP